MYLRLLLAASIVLAFILPELQADVFYYIPLQELRITDGALPEDSPRPAGQRQRRPGWNRRSLLNNFMQPYAVTDNKAAEIYVQSGQRNGWWPTRTVAEQIAQTFIAVRAPESQAVKGSLFVPNRDWTKMQKLTFSVPAAAKSGENARDQFFLAKEQHYKRLLDMDIPGAAWFRHQMIDAQKERENKPYTKSSPLTEITDNQQQPRPNELASTYSLFSGGRAISENLQLDRHLQLREVDGEEMVMLSQIQGVTTAEIDWAPLIQGKNPATDVLASAIPKDQHALFFPSFQAMLTMIDEATARGTPVLRMLEPRAEDARTRERYETQLCLKADDLARKLGPKLVASVAYTGSDPYLRTGSDLAILFEAKNPLALLGMIAAKQAAAIKGDTSRVSGIAAGVDFQGVVNPSRTVSSYLAQTEGIIIVANSLVQLERIIKTTRGKSPSIAEAPEYTFFRDRYKKAEPETAFLVLTDATIRRWCNPKWRISASRRTRAAAALSELTVRYLPMLAEGKLQSGPLDLQEAPEQLGKLNLTQNGITSSRYGHLEFLTPIVELDLKKATAAEKQAYDWFRRSYERNWRGFFDPIAVRFVVGKDAIAADLTVRPLIAGSDYREFMSVTGNAAIDSGDGDPHKEALIHMVISIDKDSDQIRQFSNFAQQMASGLQANPLGWVGDWLSVYVDRDPLWDQLHNTANQEDENRETVEDFIEKHVWELPVALVINVNNSFKLTGFLTALRAFVEQTSPGMTNWETRKHGELAYVCISPSAQARQSMRGNEQQNEMAVCYAIARDALVISPDEKIIKRALDRSQGKTGKEKTEYAAMPWLGRSFAGQAGEGALTVLQALYMNNLQNVYQRHSWGNIFILNEWKRRFNSKAPVQFHLEHWNTLLVCPGGGQYQWDEKYQTMKSTAYGSPATPEVDKTLADPLESMKSLNLGVTFEDDGLRARARIHRAGEE